MGLCNTFCNLQAIISQYCHLSIHFSTVYTATSIDAPQKQMTAGNGRKASILSQNVYGECESKDNVNGKWKLTLKANALPTPFPSHLLCHLAVVEW